MIKWELVKNKGVYRDIISGEYGSPKEGDIIVLPNGSSINVLPSGSNIIGGGILSSIRNDTTYTTLTVEKLPEIFMYTSNMVYYEDRDASFFPSSNTVVPEDRYVIGNIRNPEASSSSFNIPVGEDLLHELDLLYNQTINEG